MNCITQRKQRLPREPAARAKGMTQVAHDAGLTRASLYKALHEDGNPEFETIFRVCQALGFRLVPQAVSVG